VADSLVIIPTYNERDNIEKVIRLIFSLPRDFHVLVVDDNSPDGTAELVRKLITKFPDNFSLKPERANWDSELLTSTDSNGR